MFTTDVTRTMFGSYSVRRAHGYHQQNHYHGHHQPQQPMLVCQGCGFSTRHSALLDRHRRHCFRSNRATVKADGKPSSTSTSVGQQRRVALPAPSVCRNYKCDKCAFVTNRAKLFLYHQNCIHGENINVYGCDKCEYASRHKNKVLRHQRLVHKLQSSPSNDSTVDLSNTPVAKTTSPLQQQQTSPRLQMKFDDQNSVLKTQSSSPCDDDNPLDLSASEETSAETIAEVQSISDTSGFNDPCGGRKKPFSSTPISGLVPENTCEQKMKEEVTNGERASLNAEIVSASNLTAPDALSEATTKMMLIFGFDESTGSIGTPTVPLLRCRYCRYTNRHKWKMASHVRASHSAGRPVYRCPECPQFATDSRVEWSAHRSRHSGKAMFECPECAYATTMKRNYERHLERHRAGGPRRCGLCSYSSTGEGAIQRHMAEYHPPSPNRPLPPQGDETPPCVVSAVTTCRAQQLPATVSSEIIRGDNVFLNSNVCSEPLVTSMERQTLVSPSMATTVETVRNSRCHDSSSLSMSASHNLGLASLIARPPALVKSIVTNDITTALLSSSTMRISVSASGSQEPHGGELSPTASIGRCVCPLCPLSYKRPADLNRHMKQKHETTLKEFVLRNRLDQRTTGRGASPSWPPLHTISGSSGPKLPVERGLSPTQSLPVATGTSISSLVSQDDASSESATDAPINLSLKDAKPAHSSMPSLASSKLNKASYCEQNEPLDLSLGVASSGGGCADQKNVSIVVSSVAYGTAALLPRVQLSALLRSNPVTQESLSVHTSSKDTLVRTTAGYPCGRCSYVSKRASDLRRHQLVHSASTKRYRCPHCPVDRSYKLQFDLGRHLARAHGHLSTSSRHMAASSKRHARSGSLTVTLPTVPNVSERRMSTKAFETPAWSSTGSGKNHLACPYCQYVGKSLAELERHARLHSGEKPHRCPLCTFSTIWKSDMKVHLQKLHRDEIAAFGDFDELLDQICRNVPIVVDAAITGTGNNSIKSEVIAAGSNMISVDYNMNVETPDSRKNTLENGVSIETGSFLEQRTADQNFNHVSVALTGGLERPLGRCPLCPFQCQTPSEMSLHLESHENKTAAANLNTVPCIMQFVCVRCCSKFTSRSDARNHVVLEHSEIPDPDRVIEEKNSDYQPIPAVRISGRRQEQVFDTSDGAVTTNVVADGTPAEANGGKVAESFSRLIKTDGDKEMTLVNDVEKLAEQYANVVTEMLYGNDNSSPAINQLCRYAATGPSLPTDLTDGSHQVKVSTASGSRSTTSSPFGLVAGSLKQNRLSLAGSMSRTVARFRPYKCSQCGKRSNWRWDLKKHIRASRHPHAEVVVMSDREARESFHEIADQMYQKRSALVLHSAENPHVSNNSFSCSTCGLQLGTKMELLRHTASSHPVSESVTSRNDVSVLSATSTLRPVSASASCVMKNEMNPPEERALYTVDRQKLKRLHCSVCPYRSNFRSDVGRHIRHKHPNVGARIEIMTSAEAAATLTDYLDTWARKKFVLSPTKLYRSVDYTSLVERQQNNIVDGGVSATLAMPSGNVMGHCSAAGVLKVEEAAAETELEDETMFWKCATCDFTDPGKQGVIEHWQRCHSEGEESGDLEGCAIPVLSSDVNHVRPSSSTNGNHSDTTSVFRQRASSVGDGVFRGGKSLQCDVCPYRTKKLGLLTIHKTYHRPQLKNSHKCPFCPYYVCAPRLLHQHVRIHSGSTGTSSINHNRLPTLPSNIDDRPEGEDSNAVCHTPQCSTDIDGATRALYSCSSCPYIGNNRNDYIYHRQFHRPRPSAPFKCDKCPFWVGQRRLLTQHRRIHDQSYRLRREQYLFTNSGSSTNSLHQFSDKEKSKEGDRLNPSDDKHNLARCASEKTQNLDVVKSDTTKADVALSTNSPGSPAFPSNEERKNENDAAPNVRVQRRVQRTIWRCDRCPYATAKRSQLETHRQLHGSRQRHTCDKCDYSVSGVHLLLQHIRLHEGGPPGNTNESKRESDSSTPNHPQQQHQVKDEDREATKSTLVVDDHSHHSTSSPSVVSRPPYRCDKCPYANARRDHLLCHSRFHSGAGPLQCPHCDYSVSKVHLLTQHIRVHAQSVASSSAITASTSESSPVHFSSLAATGDARPSPPAVTPDHPIYSKPETAAVTSPRRRGGGEKTTSCLPDIESAKVRFMRSLELKAN